MVIRMCYFSSLLCRRKLVQGLFAPLTASLVVFFILASACTARAVNENCCYYPSIKTIQLYKEGFEMSPPIIQLDSKERLRLCFDDLDQDIKRFKFTIIHCEADWTTSTDLTVADYINGYREENIDQVTYSYNTTVKYIHFNATFPTANMQPRLSGNYLLKVYEEDTSRIVFTARFMMVESSPVVAEGNVVQGTRMADRNARQQVDLLVKLNGFQVFDVGHEVRVVVQQNGRWDNVLRLSKPRFARSDELDYRYDETISFNGGNQFRNFDTKSLIAQSERISRIVFDTVYHVFLLNDQPRTFKQYSFEKDLNGKYFIKNEEYAENSSTEADYTWVHFFLPYPAYITTGEFYVFGQLADWQMNESNRMRFNFDRKGYELNLLLKQGYYNYMYVVKEKGKSTGDESFIEGSHWDAENDYTIYVYYHASGTYYDRLVAVNFLNSIQK